MVCHTYTYQLLLELLVIARLREFLFLNSDVITDSTADICYCSIFSKIFFSICKEKSSNNDKLGEN